MNDRVFKYALEITQRQLVQMPRGARVLSVAIERGGIPVMFALVDDRKPVESRIIRTARTGETFNAAGCRFIGTLCFEQVGHTFHVFEQTEGVPDVREPRFQQDYREVSEAVPYAPDPTESRRAITVEEEHHLIPGAAP